MSHRAQPDQHLAPVQRAASATWCGTCPGFKHVEGKDAFDGEIENENFVGSPTLHVDRMIEEGDVVVAIGIGSSTQASGVAFQFAFCDVFTFAGDRIRRVES